MLHAGHHVEHIGALFPLHVDRHRNDTLLPHDGLGFLVVNAYRGDVANKDRCAVAAGNNHVFDLLDLVELAECADHVAALVLPQVAGRCVLVGTGQRLPELDDGDLSRGELHGIDAHLQLFDPTTVDIAVGNSFDLFQAGFDRIFGKTPQPRHVNAIGDQVRQLHVLFGQSCQRWQMDLVGLPKRRQHVSELRKAVAVGSKLGAGRRQRREDEPGDRTVARIDRSDTRLVRVLGVFANLFELFGDFDERCVQIGTDLELHRDTPLPVAARAPQFDHPGDALEMLFLAVDNLFFNFLGAGAGPAGIDRYGRFRHFGRELDRDLKQGDQAEHGDQDDPDCDLDRIADRKVGYLHGHLPAWRMA